MDRKRGGWKFQSESRIDVFLREDPQLFDRLAKDGSTLVDRVKESKEVLAEVPFSSCHGGSKKSNGVGRGVVELFEVVEDEEVGSCRLEEVGGETGLQGYDMSF